MSYTIKPNTEKKYITVTYKGSVPVKDFADARLRAAFLLNMNYWKNILVDLKEAILQFSEVDNISFAITHDIVLPEDVKMAVIADMEQHKEQLCLHKKMATQWGVAVELFNDENEAIEWFAKN